MATLCRQQPRRNTFLIHGGRKQKTANGGIPMRKQTARHLVLILAPIILAVMLAVFWTVAPARGAETRMTRPTPTMIEITGGEPARAWTLRYGTQENAFEPQFVLGQRNLAWFSQGGWLRQIDTWHGVVVGRWHFPGIIVALEPTGNQIRVSYELPGMPPQYRQTVTFDPASPQIPQATGKHQANRH